MIMKKLLITLLVMVMMFSATAALADNTTAGDTQAGSILQEDLPVVTEQGENMILVRWNSYIFYEFVLPNGKTIIFDPYMYEVKNQYTLYPDIKASEYINGCDYIIITHSHGDHTRDLPDLLTKFPEAYVVAPEEGLLAMLYTYNINSGSYRILPVTDGEKLEFEDFTLEVSRGLHTFAGGLATEGELKQIDMSRYIDENGVFDSLKYDNGTLGGRSMMNYKLTTNDGFTITMWAGEIGSEVKWFFYRDTKPDIMFYQNAKVNLGGDRDNPDTTGLAKMIDCAKPAICLPAHQNDSSWENILKAHDKCVSDLIAMGSEAKTQFFSPDPNYWYGFTKDTNGDISIFLVER